MLLSFIKDIFKSSFARSAAVITGGTAIAQLLNAVFYPVITRLYSPGEFGVFAIFMAILGILVIIGTLRYENCIPIAEDDEKAINSLALSFIVLFILLVLITLIFFAFGCKILSWLNAEALIKYKYLISLGLLLAVSSNILMQWGFRKKSFKNIARTKVSRSVAMNATQVGLGSIGIGPLGLLLGKISGESAGSATLGLSLLKKDKHLLSLISFNKIKWAARRYIWFPMYSTPSQLFNKAGIELPIFFITSIYGSSVVGLYGLAHLIVSLPVVLIGVSVSDVFYAEAASLGKKNPLRIKDMSQKLLKRLLVIGIVPLFVLLLFGPFLFGFVFGSEWYEAGIYARIISLLVFVRFIFTPVSRIFFVFEKQKTALILNFIRLVLVLTTFLAASLFNLNSYYAVSLYSFAMIIVYSVAYYYANKIINQEIKKNS